MAIRDLDWDIYSSELAEHRLRDDMQPVARSLYTVTKDDHPMPWTTQEPCGCEQGDDAWAESGAMSVHFPPVRDIEAG